ncbi:zinc ribbon domain-containing protein [Kocuria sp. U4B]
MSQFPPNGSFPQGPQYNQQPGPYPGHPEQFQPNYGQQPVKKKGKKRWLKWTGMGVGAFLLLSMGAAMGGASDPTTSTEYVALASEKEEVEANYSSLQGEYETMSSGLEEKEAALKEREEAVKEAEGALKEREGKVKEAEGAVKEREEAVSGAEKTKAENTILEGTWTVGTDIAPGTYRTTDTVGSRCYWAILTSGTNGDDIISNDIPGGGRPTVTIAEGQDFETSNCGTWELQ